MIALVALSVGAQKSRIDDAGLTKPAVAATEWRVLGLRLSYDWNGAETAITTAEFGNCPAEFHYIEIRPHTVCEYQFGIRAFPEQEVAEPLLAASSDQ